MKAQNLDTMLNDRVAEINSIISKSLCANCINRDDCTYLAGTSAPIHSCEMYDYGQTTKTRLVLLSPPGYTVEPHSSQAPLLGLCINCDNRESCQFEKPAGGVWYCEEYR